MAPLEDEAQRPVVAANCLFVDGRSSTHCRHHDPPETAVGNCESRRSIVARRGRASPEVRPSRSPLSSAPARRSDGDDGGEAAEQLQRRQKQRAVTARTGPGFAPRARRADPILGMYANSFIGCGDPVTHFEPLGVPCPLCAAGRWPFLLHLQSGSGVEMRCPSRPPRLQEQIGSLH